jgi:hypothetical protein
MNYKLVQPDDGLLEAKICSCVTPKIYYLC